LLGLSAVIAMGCLAAAASGVSSSQACSLRSTPSKLDYLVLASIADTPHLLAFGGYRSTAQERSDSTELRGQPVDISLHTPTQ
jgi:hypothetical protein